MTEIKHFIAGTRGSQMALTQTGHVIDQLKSHYPDITIETKVITTRGDVDTAPIPLDSIGKAWFTKEIEQALLKGDIDFAVHSMKDVPPELPGGLIVFPILKRDDPRDVLVSLDAKGLVELPQGAIIGTDSLRRKALLLKQRPDLRVKSARGNANTRLQKLEAGKFDALVMAAAGLERIGRSETIAEYFDPTTFTPAIGQGALAIEARTVRIELLDMLMTIQDEPTQQAIAAEHAFAQEIGAGCKLPVACYVHFVDGKAHVNGMVGSMDGKQCTISTTSGDSSDASAIARQLARELSKEPFVAEYTNAAHR